jgi:hypothetical protein
MIQEISNELSNLKRENAQMHQNHEDSISKLSQIDEEKLESRLKQSAISALEKRLDKVASSILSAVDQKLNKDAGMQQKIFFTKLDEKISKVESDLAKKSAELTNLINSKILSSKTETSEAIQDLQRTYKIIVGQIDVGQEQNSKISQNLKSRQDQQEQITHGIRKDMEEFTSGIVEDVEQLRAQINSISINIKPKDAEITKEEINTLLSHKIPEYLQSYSKKSDFTDLKTYIDLQLTQSKSHLSATSAKLSEIPDQIYRNLAQSLSEINAEWEDKFSSSKNDLDSLKADLFDNMSKYECNLKTTVESNKELVGNLQGELGDLKLLYSSIGTKATEHQNSSNLVDTKHDTVSKFYSNEKQEKSKDIEVNEQSESSYQEFKVSPVKMHHEHRMHETKMDSDFKDKNHKIEDSSMFGLSPTPKMSNKGFSRTPKDATEAEVKDDDEHITSNCSSMIINEDVDDQSLYKKVIKMSKEDSPNIEAKGNFYLKFNSEIGHIQQLDSSNSRNSNQSELNGLEESKNEIENELEDQSRNESLNISDNDLRNDVFNQSRDESQNESRNQSSNGFLSQSRNQLADDSRNGSLNESGNDSRNDSRNESRNMSNEISHILVEESIEEIRNRSDMYDHNISINNVVDELTEIILAGETFGAIDEL